MFKGTQFQVSSKAQRQLRQRQRAMRKRPGLLDLVRESRRIETSPKKLYKEAVIQEVYNRLIKMMKKGE